MRLKVDVKGDEQDYHLPDKKVVTIGRAPDNDIQLLVEGISRAHLEVLEEDGNCFVVDKGSSNGTFLNELRLPVGEKTPFNSFFPLKLGFHVQLYLLDETVDESVGASMEIPEQAANQNNEAPKKIAPAQRVPANNPSKKYGTKTSLKRKTAPARDKSLPKRSFFSRHKSESILALVIFVICSLTLAYYYEEFSKGIFATPDASPQAEARPIEKKKINASKIQDEPAQKMPVFTNPDYSLRTQESGVIDLDKCLGDLEKVLCDLFQIKVELSFGEGFLRLADRLYLVLYQEKLIEKLRRYPYTEKEISELITSFRIEQGRRFSVTQLEADNYIAQDVDSRSELSALASISYALGQKEIIERITAEDELNSFYVLLAQRHPDTQERSLFAYAIFSREELLTKMQSAAFLELERSGLFYHRSGLKRNIQALQKDAVLKLESF